MKRVHLHGPPLDSIQHLHTLPVLGAPGLDAVLQMGPQEGSAERDRITSLDLLATLLLMQPEIRLAFWAVRAHCWLMSIFPSTSTPRSFLAGLHSILSQLLLVVSVTSTQLNLPTQMWSAGTWRHSWWAWWQWIKVGVGDLRGLFQPKWFYDHCPCFFGEPRSSPLPQHSPLENSHCDTDDKEQQQTSAERQHDDFINNGWRTLKSRWRPRVSFVNEQL